MLVHPIVIGELACRTLRRRAAIPGLLRDLPAAPVATDAEALAFIESRRLTGPGIGYADVHLLASTVLAPGTRLWTRDRRLARLARSIGVARRRAATLAAPTTAARRPPTAQAPPPPRSSPRAR